MKRGATTAVALSAFSIDTYRGDPCGILSGGQVCPASPAIWVGPGRIDMSHESKHTVLLIEEDVSLRRLMVLGLEYRGMRVVEAYAPGDFSTIEGQQADLLVLDVDGGISSDWSLLAVVASHPYLSTLPVVVLACCMLPSSNCLQKALRRRYLRHRESKRRSWQLTAQLLPSPSGLSSLPLVSCWPALACWDQLPSP